MKRRDLLKSAGTMMLAAPVARASALVKSDREPAAQVLPKTLVVSFSGAFCFWQEEDRFKVMVPPVGINTKDPHLPWAETTANAKPLLGFQNFTLTVPSHTPPSGKGPIRTGTDVFEYPQESGTGGVPPLLNLFVPTPSQIIGVRPTGVKMVCKGTPYPYCEKYTMFASGLSFVYQNVDVDRVMITPDSPGGPADSYKACFTNDATLQEATLTIHLTPLTRVTDPGHKHAYHVWTHMLSMYPWMLDDIQGIDFCPDFDPSTCPASCGAGEKRFKPDVPQGGPSNDCQVPNMLFPLGPVGNRKK